MNPLKILLLFPLLLLFSCKTKKNATPPEDEDCMAITVDGQLFKECQESPDFTIDTAYIEGKNLFVKVGYSGGCKEHTFEFLWDQVMMKSYPPQFRLCLAHNANGDNCEAFLSKTLCVRLDGLGNPIGIVRLNGWKGRLQFGEKK